jgi:hypothetical protein
MISLCLIDIKYSQVGNIVEVLWGEPGSNQKLIKVVVSQFPHLNLERNKEVDLNLIADRYKK